MSCCSELGQLYTVLAGDLKCATTILYVARSRLSTEDTSSSLYKFLDLDVHVWSLNSGSRVSIFLHRLCCEEQGLWSAAATALVFWNLLVSASGNSFLQGDQFKVGEGVKTTMTDDAAHSVDDNEMAFKLAVQCTFRSPWSQSWLQVHLVHHITSCLQMGGLLHSTKHYLQAWLSSHFFVSGEFLLSA